MSIEPSSNSLANLFAAQTSGAPGAAALICGATGAVTSRSELLERSRELAEELEGLGLVAGDSLAVQLPNSPEFVATFLAARQLGLAVVPIDRDAQEKEVAAILQHFGITALAHAPTTAANRSYTPRFVRHSSSGEKRFNDIALLKLTSGSTGKPKGILTTEENLMADCRNICSTMQIAAHDLNLGAIPFSHSYGFSNLVTPLLMQGTPIVFSNDYLPLSLMEMSNRFGVTVVPGIPLVFDHLSRLPLDDGLFRSVRTFLSAGAPLQAATSRRFFERFGTPIHTFYGCSECGGISYDRDGRAVEEGHVGLPMDGVSLSVDAAGRLLVRSAAVAAGYLDTTPDTSLKFGEGSFATDDLVELLPGGELKMTGRLGDLINTAGKKVNPREVEATILQMSGIREVKVYGENAGARGEIVAAVVVADEGVSREEIREFCRARLSLHKVPRIVKLIDVIPVDERGKVKRAALAAL
jgi:long-chain acyl-CoA synthetase